MAKSGRFYVVKFTPTKEERFECSSQAEALALAAKLRRRGLASAFERRDGASLLLLPGLAPVTPRKRTPPRLTKLEADAVLSIARVAFVGDDDDVIAHLGPDRKVHAAARRGIEKLERIARGG